MRAAPQKPEKKLRKKRLIIATLALIFAAAWAIIGILSILNIIQTNWLGISSVIFAFIGVSVAIAQYLFPLPSTDSNRDSLVPHDVPISLAQLTPTLTSFQGSNRGGTELKLVDVSVVEESSDENRSIGFEKGMLIIPTKRAPHVKLDFKLRNVGTQVCFLKRAKFSILEIATFQPKPLLGLPSPIKIILDRDQYLYERVPVSENYDISFLDVVLNPSDETRSVTSYLSQKIAPNEVDRFTFTIGYKGSFNDLPKWYLLKVKLIFNETDDFIETNDILLCLPPIRDDQVGWLETFSYPPNKEAARRLLPKGAIKSPSVELARQYLAKKE